MNQRYLFRLTAVPAFLIAIALAETPLRAQLPVSGWPVPELHVFDDAMQNFLAANGLTGAVLAISKDHRIVYQHGFGFMHPSPDFTSMPENALMRIASVEKTLTAAAINRLIATTFGDLEWSDHVFNLGQPGGGLLNYLPYDGELGDSWLPTITVRHLLDHEGGWDRETAEVCDQGDPMFDEECICDALGIPSPGNQDDIIRYMLSQPLQFQPGLGYQYSNFGYLLLGKIVAQISGMSPLDYFHSQIVTTEMWVPSSEVILGRSFDASQNVREPTYLHEDHCTNVFDPGGSDVWCPYGGWAQENFVGHGNFVASALPLLVYMDYYQANSGGDSGVPLAGGNGHPGGHGGLLGGTSTMVYQRGDGINIVLLFNSGTGDWAPAGPATDMVNAVIEAGGFTWPTRAVDGFWVDFNYGGPEPEFGGYNAPFRTMGAAIYTTGGDGSKLHFKPGSNPWTGTLNYKMRFDAPLGTVRIGI